ncbi:non-hydrolyzing UDP-N-acetylglucosamine 2-epimerase [Actinokineospora guangxiensis]|uniref:UDP-N-acetylglucosamine 2-epimerase (non-hydrolyzing) n=1 Tax=Actinokineospora guangxiensis TaxID=1490288 RepID=A0ABW0EM71_9PSEU
MTPEVLVLVGTRAEAVKVAPVVLASPPAIRAVVVHSGQHGRTALDALAAFDLRPAESLSLHRVGGQADLVAGMLPGLDALIARRRPAAVLVQGDTTTALAGALASHWRGVPLVHLEAGLRSGSMRSPFPEEANRRIIARLATLHLAPTARAADALGAEGVPGGDIAVTGNTVVDAVAHLTARDLPASDPELAAAERTIAALGHRLMLVTAHRRENWGEPLKRIFQSIAALTAEHPDVHVLLPTHPNPSVAAQARVELSGRERVTLTEPLNYPDLLRALRVSALVLTDSGGLQEEAPSFRVPVLVLRDRTERPEAVEAGRAWLVGTESTAITAAGRRLLAERPVLPPGNPFGDGRAAPRVVAAILRSLERSGPQQRPEEPFAEGDGLDLAEDGAGEVRIDGEERVGGGL